MDSGDTIKKAIQLRLESWLEGCDACSGKRVPCYKCCNKKSKLLEPLQTEYIEILEKRIKDLEK